MGIQLIDGKGTGGAAEVRNQKLVTLTDSLTPLALASLDGRAYSINNVTFTPGAADTLVMIRNDHPSKNFHIYSVGVQNDILTEIQCHIVTLAYTSAGTAIVPVNLNSSFGNSSQLECRGNETGNTQGTVVYHWQAAAVTVHMKPVIDFGGAIIIAPGHAFGIDVVVNVGAGAYVSVLGYQEA